MEHEQFRIIAISENTGGFGHHSHVMVGRDGSVWKVERIRSNHPGQWRLFDFVDVPISGGVPLFAELGAEFSTRSGIMSAEPVKEIFSPEYPEIVNSKAEAKAEKLQQDRATPEELEIIASMGDGTHGHGDEPGRPTLYGVPLKSREAIAYWLNSRQHWDRRSYDHKTWQFCFNVKLNGLDLGFDHLLEIRRKDYSSNSRYQDDYYVADCRARYVQLYGKTNQKLYEFAVEDATSNVLDDDAYKSLWADASIEADLGFNGRSGGWLVVYKFNGITLSDVNFLDPEEIDYRTLRQLYEYITILSHDFGPGKPEAEVEYRAAFFFFDNNCSDIATVDKEVGSFI